MRERGRARAGGVAEAKAGAEEGVALGGALGVEAVVVFVLVKQYSLVDVKDVHVLRIFELILDLAIVAVLWEGQELLVEFGVGCCIVFV